MIFLPRNIMRSNTFLDLCSVLKSTYEDTRRLFSRKGDKNTQFALELICNISELIKAYYCDVMDKTDGKMLRAAPQIIDLIKGFKESDIPMIEDSWRYVDFCDNKPLSSNPENS